MLAGIVLAAALAANAPTYPPQQAQNRRPAVTQQQAEPTQQPKQAQDSPGASEVSPLHVKATCDKGCADSEGEKGWWRKLWTDPIAAFTAVLAFFTIWLAFATNASAIAAKRAARVAEDALTKLERATVVFLKFDIRPIPNRTGTPTHWQFLTELENTGSTRTSGGRHHVNWKTFMPDIPDDFAFPDLDQDGTEIVSEGKPLLLAPKQKKTFAKLNIPLRFIEAVQNRQARLYLWGWVTYRDIFDGSPTHLTKFCMELDSVEGDLLEPIVLARPPTYIVSFRAYDRHNCMDQDCAGEPGCQV